MHFTLLPIPGNVRELQEKQMLTEKEYRDMREKYEDDFEAGMGAEAIKKLLEEIDLEQTRAELKEELTQLQDKSACVFSSVWK